MSIGAVKSLLDLKKVADNYLVNGVSSSARINPYTGFPMYLSKADGAYLWDATGKKYIDYFMGHGACLLGHNRKEIKEAIITSLDKGWTAEFDSWPNIELAKKLTEIIPSYERIRYTSSGTESTNLCMRIARAYTGKDKILRIDGHFHGTNDYALCNWLAADIDKNNPGGKKSKVHFVSKGIPKAIENTVSIVPWHDIEAIKNVLASEKDQIAAIMMVPIDYNNGCIYPSKEYLQEVRSISREYGVLLIFDEILSCFRTGLSCAQGHFGVTPDLCSVGKVVSNGVPIGIVGGKKEVMDTIVNEKGPVASGGTYSGNLLGVVSALAALDVMSKPDFYPNLFKVCLRFFTGMEELFKRKNFPARVQHLGSNFFIYVGTTEEIKSYKDFHKIDKALAGKFFKRCIERGLYFHTDFTVSAAHTFEDIDQTLSIMGEVIDEL